MEESAKMYLVSTGGLMEERRKGGERLRACEGGGQRRSQEGRVREISPRSRAAEERLVMLIPPRSQSTNDPVLPAYRGVPLDASGSCR